jgi:hypothetical protein
MTDYFTQISWKTPKQLTPITTDEILLQTNNLQHDIILWILPNITALHNAIDVLSETHKVKLSSQQIDFDAGGRLMLRSGDRYLDYAGLQCDRIYIPREYRIDFLMKMCTHVRDTHVRKGKV